MDIKMPVMDGYARPRVKYVNYLQMFLFWLFLHLHLMKKKRKRSVAGLMIIWSNP